MGQLAIIYGNIPPLFLDEEVINNFDDSVRQFIIGKCFNFEAIEGLSSAY